jgi:hypothetical protein
MATNLKSHTDDVSLTRFFAGKDKGTCVQVTTTARYVNSADPRDFFKHISLTRDEAKTLAFDLMAFATHQEEECA